MHEYCMVIACFSALCTCVGCYWIVQHSLKSSDQHHHFILYMYIMMLTHLQKNTSELVCFWNQLTSQSHTGWWLERNHQAIDFGFSDRSEIFFWIIHFIDIDRQNKRNFTVTVHLSLYLEAENIYATPIWWSVSHQLEDQTYLAILCTVGFSHSTMVLSC